MEARWIAASSGALAKFAALTCIALATDALHAASVDAAGSYIVFPVVVQSASYSSEITIVNVGSLSVRMAVDYVGGKGTAAAGPRSCTELYLAASKAAQFNVGTQCSLPAGTNFGVLRVHEYTYATGMPATIHGHSRVANPQGIGFSVPAVPVSVFDSSASHVIGLRRQAAAPGYQSNCFVGSNLEGTTYEVSLFAANGTQIGNTLTGALGADELIRFVDIFSAVGAPPGDYSNVRATFAGSGANNGPGLMAFCTVQDNTRFGADLRIAGATTPFDNTRSLRSSVTNTFRTYDKHVYHIGFRPPDWLRCYVTGARKELRIVADDTYGDPVVVGGGNNTNDTGRLWLAQRSPYSPGPWRVEVSIRDFQFPLPSLPQSYTLVCESGSGHAALASWPAIEADDF